MKRRWFQDTDGTFYRNVPLILAEQKKCLGLLLLRGRRLRQLEAEWQMAWRDGVIRKAELGRGDKLVQPRPFREAYPDHPGLWMLDELEDSDG